MNFRFIYDTLHRTLCMSLRQTQIACASQRADRGVCLTHPSPSMRCVAYTSAPAAHRTFSRTFGQSQAYYNRLKVNHPQNLTCRVAVPSSWQCDNTFNCTLQVNGTAQGTEWFFEVAIYIKAYINLQCLWSLFILILFILLVQMPLCT